MAGSPFRLAQPAGITRRPDGKFEEVNRQAKPNAIPANPLAEEASGSRPQEWAPGIGQGSAPVSRTQISWPAVAKPGRGPMKVG